MCSASTCSLNVAAASGSRRTALEEGSEANTPAAGTPDAMLPSRTNTGSGSDALAARATAIRSPDGSHWLLNGEKMWVTNAAFADVFITFAQVDGKRFSCFVVEKTFPGVATGAEEHKMGLKGSSTRPLVLTDAQVPIGNQIGDIGRGHEVAFNILNIGRAKLGVAAVGGSKTALRDAISYAKQRMAFGKSISSFGAIQHKLAEMSIRIWVAEAMAYRTANLMDRALSGIDIHDRAEVLPAMKEYAVECSIVKVFGSETLDYAVDEAVQIHGGYGFTSEYPVERYYRDSRVNRIFEGTNEINRMMIAGMLLKRSPGSTDLTATSGPLSGEAAALGRIKKASRLVMESLTVNAEQEVLMLFADIAMEIYAMDTAIRRARKMDQTSRMSELCVSIVQTFVNDSISRVRFSARQILAATPSASPIATRLSALETLLHWTPVDTVAARRRIAQHILEFGHCTF
jgi:alkylation response protein AidB-like acyl-CoA dehydrogenase